MNTLPCKTHNCNMVFTTTNKQIHPTIMDNSSAEDVRAIACTVLAMSVYYKALQILFCIAFHFGANTDPPCFKWGLSFWLCTKQ